MAIQIEQASEELGFLINTAIQAGSLLKEKFYSRLSFEKKEDGSWVSEADRESDKLIRKGLENFFPEYSIISEESGGKIEPKSIWVDPLDATTNFKSGFPYFCVSIGVVKRNKATKGVVYNPVTNELFYAEKGRGAFLKSGSQTKKLSVSAVSSLQHSNIITEINQRGRFVGKIRDFYKKLQAKISRTRELGSLALDMCYVASGIFDAAIFGNNGHGYDVAAGCIILEEAGGKVTDFSGSNIFDGLKTMHDIIKGGICSNGKIHKEIEKFVDNNFEFYK